MPKRFGYLYEKIYEWSNLLLSFKQAKKSKSNREDVLSFEYDLENQLVDIQTGFREENYQFGGYRQFKIYEPKERVIHCAPFRDRVVHHAICNIINPILDKSIIPDSYACRMGKGLHRAVKRAFYCYRNSSYCYKFDIRKYFYTIDHEILTEKLNRRIKDGKVMALIARLLDTNDSGMEYYYRFEEDDLIDMMRNRGLPIGNLTSQIFGNYYLSQLDHFIKEDLQQRFYIRYMDDALVFSDSLEELRQVKKRVVEKLEEERLIVHPDKNIISSVKRGVNFLGFRFYGDRIKLQNRNLNRLKQKLKMRAKLELPIAEQLLSINGHLGFLLAGNTAKITECCFNERVFKYNDQEYKFTLNG